MEQPKYLVANPLYVKLFSNKTKKTRMSYIDEKFYEKLMWLKDISNSLKRAKARRVF